MPNQDQIKRFDDFRALHSGEAPLVMANPWDVGSAMLCAQMGFQALATTSAGYAFAVGRRDSAAQLSRAEILENAAQIVDATDLPVTADLEAGFGVAPQDCFRTIRQAIDIGLVGGSIEDATGDPDQPIFDIALATDRISAAAEAAQRQPFLLTARAENYLWGKSDLADTIGRLQAFSMAGANVLFAPGLPDLDAIRTVCAEVDKPVNVVMGLSGPNFSVAELARAGVSRISVGGSFAHAALGALHRAGREVLEAGTFGYAKDAMPDADVARLMGIGD